MALYNEILAGRFNRYLTKVMSLKGQAPAPQLSAEITPSINFRLGPDDWYHQQWNMFGFFSSVGAVAAAQGNIMLRNPVGSNIVGVIMRVMLTNTIGVADQPFVQVGPRVTDLTTVNPTTNARFDNRGNPQATLLASSQTAAGGVTLGATSTKFQAAMPLNAPPIEVVFTDIHEFTLLPGDALNIGSAVANQALNAAVWWRERSMEESERF